MSPGSGSGGSRHGTATEIAVVIADVDGTLATRPLVQGLARSLRRRGVVVAARDPIGAGAGGTTRVPAAVRRTLGSGSARPVLVLFGDETRQGRVVWGLALSGLLPKVRLVLHVGAASIPYEPSLALAFARAHLVVTESKVGARAVRQCCAEAGEAPPPVVEIPPAFPSRSDLPQLTPAGRRALRRERLGVDDNALVVGCWGRGGQEEMASMALRIFQQLTPRFDTRLLLIDEPADGNGEWATRSIGAWLGLEDRIVHEPVGPTRGSAGDAARLWGCVDIHLQPHLLADVPAPMRASCVLGVPIVATRYGAVEELLAGAASLVAPRMVVDHSAGHRMALMDPGGALAQLQRLSDDPAARRLTAQSLRELAHRWDAGALLDRWTRLLLDVAVRS